MKTMSVLSLVCGALLSLAACNGAGKTALINAFVGKAFLSQIGYMPQCLISCRYFSAKGFLLYMRALKGIPAHEAQNRVSELLAMLWRQKCHNSVTFQRIFIHRAKKRKM